MPIRKPLTPARELPKQMITRLNSEGLKALKLLALANDTTLQALTVEALNDLLMKYDQKPTIKNPLIG